MKLTNDRLKTLLSYDRNTGEFTVRTYRGGTRKIGDTAGSIDAYGYRVIKADGKPYKAHRLAWLYVNGKFPVSQIDHINHVRDDNRISNIRETSYVENGRNASIKSNNTSGVTGVTLCRGTKKWQANISVNGESKYLGVFRDISDAAKARRAAEKTYGFHCNHGIETETRYYNRTNS